MGHTHFLRNEVRAKGFRVTPQRTILKTRGNLLAALTYRERYSLQNTANRRKTLGLILGSVVLYPSELEARDGSEGGTLTHTHC